jgi:hypothetical protein
MEHIGFWSVLMVLMYMRKHKYCKENAEALLEASREFGLNLNTEQTMYAVTRIS